MSQEQPTALYVGGLDPAVTEALLQATFIAFGPLQDVHVPLDNGQCRGYGFVEYQDASDAADAVDNMNEAEILGRRIRVNVAKGGPGKRRRGKAIWDDEELRSQMEFQGLDEREKKPDDIKMGEDVKAKS